MTKKSDIRVPEGYFEDLQTRLSGIAVESTAPVRKVNFVRKVAPYFAYAASLVAAVLIGSFIIRTTAVANAEESAWEDNLVAEVLMSADPYAFFYEMEEDAINP